ncbi:MAG: hypothetical protein A3J55_02785 [Candidatus Ryanbacteria bacterium RIFCSPHIGHO2_02_FULL_45_17b]|uniref:site-specific DNA-methyltransferase (adenine-specific) n=1 Tax=Candidatus Ryanbacteria bacterium RIFCSPHIGHO2_01_FULL_45_22 TaxID=1802114 RepID=A0A1G2FZG7_9BACT|nr:MAG: hypothetical protein A2719_05675 [Candidatus Ryanbacteria bacterium RIFCSPHIGHO2_01_FULL_45_22]OGZ47338.1 MAG: hypothetical protein A3J55_02785 [Candidatus Ryanbacteria bacterium RIFCSPHIGHO2_02_FULL_45_17b]
MLDATTKRKIDSARQILVGKVPDPKAQVEQITTALVYKFMDDMDKESQELGGQTRFFANGFAKYSWTKLLDKRLSGAERLDLYVQAITNMSKNPHIPQLFKDIFKGAALPYNDAQTLNLFLKEIDGFAFDHSEDLGDAYEYLLNVVGTSGEAGQFRTPRHIIDFIVEVVAPKKNEAILDPACGTAGFLISAYKHILRQHDGKNDQTGEPTSAEKRLSPEEKQKMMSNFVGYDIDPGMMRIAIVNMYLHHFPNPKIYEYDTLTYEDRWDDTFDVILANPPFMTPKGGIRPHKRFSVQATRSEVLFVDYILEHLNIKGRAGIIVPEGVIFRNDSAYKELRKKLVEDGLYAVVSLPQGVFAKPGGKGNVKTSILFFDNQLAKRSNEILFVKVENDGFDLGAQRRKIDKDDLPEALAILDAWKNGKKQSSDLALWVKKEKISENGYYNLTSELYKEREVRKNQKWPLVEIGAIAEILNGYAFKSNNYVNNGIRIIRITNVQNGRIVDDNPKFYPENTKEPISKYELKENDLLLSLTGNVGRVGILQKEFLPATLNQRVACLRPKKDKILAKYLFYLLNRNVFEKDCIKSASGIAQKNLSTIWLSKYKIPLPPLEVQKEIVEQIEVKQNAVNHAKEIIKNLERERRYFGQSLRKLKDVEMSNLGDICENMDSKRKPVTKSDRSIGKYPYYGASGIVDYVDDYIFDGEYLLVSEDGANLLARSTPIAFSISGKTWVNNHAHILKFENSETQKLVEHYLNSIDVKQYVTGTAQPKLNQENLNKIQIPLPPIEIQKQLVAEAEKEEEIIAANRRLIELMEGKISQVLAEI